MSRAKMLGFTLAIIACTGFLSGQEITTQGMITGTVACKQRVVLPLDAAIAVRLEDVTIQDAPATVLSESILSAAGYEAPVPFELSYDPAAINPTHTYQVHATITANGTLLFTSSTAYRVLTHGAPSRVAIMLHEVGAAAAALPHLGTAGATPSVITLQDTIWKLTRLGGQPVPDNAGRNEAWIVLHKEQNKLSGSFGCRHMLGTYTLGQGTLEFTLSGTVPLLCSPDVMRQEQVFFNAMKATRGYRIVGGDTLELLLGNEVLATFKAKKKT